MDFAALHETKPDELFRAWIALLESQRKTMDAELREVFSLSCEKGWRAIRDEASFHLKDRPEQFGEFLDKLSALPGHYERAMVAFLHRIKDRQGATLFYHADSRTGLSVRGFPRSPHQFMTMGAPNWHGASGITSIELKAELRGGDFRRVCGPSPLSR